MSMTLDLLAALAAPLGVIAVVAYACWGVHKKLRGQEQRHKSHRRWTALYEGRAQAQGEYPTVEAALRMRHVPGVRDPSPGEAVPH